MDLSILIATVPPRNKYLNRLLVNLQKQIVENKLEDRIEILIYEDDFEKVLGEKKNTLYQSARGKYVVSIDDDDMVDVDYCRLICDVIDKHDVDQICIGHRYFHNNKSSWVPIEISKDYKYYSIIFMGIFNLCITKYHNIDYDHELSINNTPIIRTKESSFKMSFIILFLLFFKKTLTKGLRHTCHTTPIRREIAQSVNFSNRPREQDIEWATEIYNRGLIKTEHSINKDLYLYYYDHEMSINRVKCGWMSVEEKRKKLTETLNTIKDFEWELQPIDKINIKWI